MKLIVAGSRNINIKPEMILNALNTFELDLFSETEHEIVSGGCPTGPDSAAKELQRYIGVTYKEFPADWKKHGRSAGPIRNKQMAEYSDALLLIWDGESRGSLSMKREMEKLKKDVYEIILKRPYGN